jgi:hypothetical protein
VKVGYRPLARTPKSHSPRQDLPGTPNLPPPWSSSCPGPIPWHAIIAGHSDRDALSLLFRAIHASLPAPDGKTNDKKAVVHPLDTTV